jgi:hypothetical protein
LLPNSDHEPHFSDLYAGSSDFNSVIPLDVSYLKKILADDKSKVQKLWEHISYRMIIIHHAELTQIEKMKKERIKNLCTMCDTKIYANGESFDVSSGGVMLRGGFSKEGQLHKYDLDVIDIAVNGETPNRQNENGNMKVLEMKKSFNMKKNNISQIM